jgi:hypothetical protein
LNIEHEQLQNQQQQVTEIKVAKEGIIKNINGYNQAISKLKQPDLLGLDVLQDA